jgi:hypothetical protein
MTSLKQIIVLLIALWLLINHNLVAQTIVPSSYDQKIVIVPEGQSRTFMFTNRKGLFYYGETSLPNTSHYNGLSYLTHEFLEDYIIEIGGAQLSRSQTEVHLMGDKLVRHFKNLSIEEEISMADSLPIFMIKIRSRQKTPMAIVPLISGSNQKQDFDVDWSSSDKVLFIARKNHLVRDDDNNYPVWLGVCTYPEGEYTIVGIENLTKKSKLVDEQIFCPGRINIYLESEAIVLFIIADNKNDLIKNRNLMLKQLNIEIKRNNSQIEGVRQAQAIFNPAFVLF